MTTVRIDISPNVLDWVFSSFPEKIDSNLRLKAEKWFANEQKPAFGDIEKLSRKTNIPFGYFFLDEPPIEELPILEYRTIDSVELANPSRELIDTISFLEMAQDYAREYKRDNGYDKNSIVGLGKNLSKPELTALVRKLLKLDKKWYRETSEIFKLLRNKCVENEIIVMKNGIAGKNTRRPLNYKEFRALAMVDDYAPLIFINSHDTKNGQVFSLLHEFVHIILGESDFYNAKEDEVSFIRKNEEICNAVAGEILVPIDDFNKMWNESRNIEIIADYFRCSQMVIARKAFDCGYISRQKFNQVCNDVIKLAEDARANGEKSNGGDYYKTAHSRMDNRFFDMVCSGLADGKISYTEAFRLTNTSRNSFQGLVTDSVWEGVL